VDILKQILFWEYQQGPIHIIVWQVLYLIVLFLGLAWVMSRFLFRPVLAVVEAREERIRKAGSAERDSRRQYEETMEDYRKGLQEARREAYDMREAVQLEANEEGDKQLNAIREQSRSRIREALDGLEAEVGRSREELRGEADTLASDIASRILGREAQG
jgi:F-type H+-transporting ATPase subunit b